MYNIYLDAVLVFLQLQGCILPPEPQTITVLDHIIHKESKGYSDSALKEPVQQWVLQLNFFRLFFQLKVKKAKKI